jgi:DNA repair protein RadC
MMNIPIEERPRERFVTQGEDALSNSEILAILLGTGIKGLSALQLANRLLMHFDGLDKLLDASLIELQGFSGIGKAKAIQLRAAFSLIKRSRKMKAIEPPIISDSLSAFIALEDLFFGKKIELLAVISLDAKLALLQREIIGMGTLTEVLVHPREVFLPAIRSYAHSIVVAHNHPSGDLTPSKEDIHLAERLDKCAEILDIAILDHLIIADGQFLSLRQ